MSMLLEGNGSDKGSDKGGKRKRRKKVSKLGLFRQTIEDRLVLAVTAVKQLESAVASSTGPLQSPAPPVLQLSRARGLRDAYQEILKMDLMKDLMKEKE